MPIGTNWMRALQIACFVFFALSSAGAQAKANPQSPAAPGADYSGMYSFLRDGEFVQLTVEEQSHVIGFVSRYADAEGEGGFLDHFFKTAKLDGNQLSFTTQTVQGVWFEFRGTIERGEGKNRADESYYVLKGSLTQNETDETKKTSSRSSEVSLKSFPEALEPPQAEKK